MKRKYYLLTLLFIYFFTVPFAKAQLWSDEDYQKYSITEFLQLDEIHQIINFKTVDIPLLQAAIFYATNEKRVEHGLPLFIHHSTIEKVASEHASDMVKYNFYSHVSKVKGKKTVTDRFHLENIDFAIISENIASSTGMQYQLGRKVNIPKSGEQFTYATNKKEVILPHTYLSYAREIVGFWMGSYHHRLAILNPNHYYLGCGAKPYPNKDFYNMFYVMAVQNFGSNQ